MSDEIPSMNGFVTVPDNSRNEPGVNHDDDGTWLYGNNQSRNDENIDHSAVPTIDEINTQEIDPGEKTIILKTSLGGDDDDDDDDDDDGVEVFIGDYEPDVAKFQNARQKNRTMLTAGPVIPPKSSTTRGLDLDAHGTINGQSIYEHDLMNSYKDDEKPWKKPGADISDYFNYGFTEETWTQYCDKQRRLRTENHLARFNPTHISPMPTMLPGHPSMIHPLNHHPLMMINKPVNMPIVTRSINMKKPDGKIDVIGGNDHTSRRPIYEAPNNFEPSLYMNGPQFSNNQTSNGPTVGDLVSASSPTNGPPSSGNTHPMQMLGPPRLPIMSLPHGIQFRPQFGHPHAPGGQQFFPRGPAIGMHGDRPPQPYFIPRHPQSPWDKTGMQSLHGFPPVPFPPQLPVSSASNNGRIPISRNSTPEHHSSRSATPEETRPSNSANTGSENEKLLKEDRYKERYRDDRDHHSSSHRRPSSKDHSRHRNDKHEYERPRNDKNSSRDRDDKYEHYSRKRHHKEDNNRHHRSSNRSPSKTNSSIESSQILNDQTEIDSTINRSRRDDSQRSSSHHKKSSKRSRHDSNDERNSTHHHRRSKDKLIHNNKKSTNQNESVSDLKEQINE